LQKVVNVHHYTDDKENNLGVYDHPSVMQKIMQFRYCNKCNQVKPPRTHHCKTCNQCIMKMDHHCPFVDNCVGLGNHKLFWNFLMYASLGCLHAVYSALTAGERTIKENMKMLDNNI